MYREQLLFLSVMRISDNHQAFLANFEIILWRKPTFHIYVSEMLPSS